MDELTLGEKTYLSNIIERFGFKEPYQIAEGFTRRQRGLFLKLYLGGEFVKAKDIIENVRAFNTKII